MKSFPEADHLGRWLVDTALPLWERHGADRNGWGFEESLAPDGTPTQEHRRCRVQGRQAYVFAEVGAMGWSAPRLELVEAGLGALNRHYRRPDGLYRTLVSRQGVVIDDRAKLYDHAFILLALAAAQPLRPESAAEALALLDRLEARFRHDGGGFRETEGIAYLSNPLMHLFETSQAWDEAGGGPRWSGLADEIAGLALDRLIDWNAGFIREVFDAQWRPAEGPEGRRFEPGHQFEWAWLLKRWGLRRGEARAHKAAAMLHTAGQRGLSPSGEVALDDMDDSFMPRSLRARLWPQTERLKSATLQALHAEGRESAERYLAEARTAAAALLRYLATPKPGLWRDKLGSDGTFAEEPAPASTLYHLVTAVKQLRELPAAI